MVTPIPWTRPVWTAFAIGAVSIASAGQLSIDLPSPPISTAAGSLFLGDDARNGFVHRAQPGEPRLPERTLSILLPPQADPSTVTVSISGTKETDEPNVFDMSPGYPVAISAAPVWPVGKRIQDGRDLDIYGKDAFHPAKNFGEPHVRRWGAFQILEVAYHPWKWNPRRGILRRATGGKLVVKYAERKVAASSLSKTELAEAKEVSSLVSNPEVVATYTGGVAVSAASETGTYAIVTTNAIRTGSTNLLAFARSKVARGFAVELATQTGHWRLSSGAWSCIQADCGGGWGGGTGDAAAEALRAWLRANYVSRDIQYALLIGNPNPTSGDVPMKMTWPRRAEGDYPECPTDYFFAELSGIWDVDANGYAGEYPADYVTGGIDKFPEIVVGRIPYYGYMADLDKILAKTIAFENATDIAWRKNALLPMEPSDASTPGYQLGEQIRTNFLIPREFSSTRIYDEDYGVAPEITPCNIANVRNAWSTGTYGVTTWWTHGSETSAADIFRSSDASYLNDAYPSFTFQNSCTNGSPEWSNNLGYALLRNGAIGTVSASRVSWYWVGQKSFTGSPQSNAMMAYAYTGALTYDSLVAGKALNKVRRSMIVDGTWWAMNLADFNLYGDPSVGLFTSAPSRPVPTGLAAVAGIRQVSLSWDVFAGAIKYYVLRSVAGGELVVVDSTTTNSFKDVGLTDNTAYTYAVSARTSVEVTGNSSTVRSLTAPAVVLDLTATAANQRAILSWSASQGATSYRIYRLEVEGDPTLVGTSETASYTVLGLENGKEYGFVVVPVNENGTVGSPSEPVTVIPVFTLDRVQGLAAIGGDAVVDLTWQAVDGADSYAVFRGTGKGVMVPVDTVAAVAFHDQGLVNGTEYAYAVAAMKADVVGPVSVTVRATPLVAVPAVPTGIAAVGKISAVDVSWKASVRATGYDVYRSSGTTGYVKVGTTTALSFNDAPLTPYVRYFYRIAATNATGSSALSDTVGATVLAPVPAAPASVVATAGDRSIAVTWAAAQYASTYTVKTATVAGGPYTVAKSGISGTSANLTGLVNGTTYYVVVSATNASGEGPNSVEASAKPVPPPSGLKVMYKVGDASATDNTIRPLIQLVNTGNAAIALNDVTIRYWFTNEQAKGQSYWCDWAQIGCSNLTGTYKALAKSVPGADGYMEIAFKTTVGSLAAGANSGDIQSRITRSDWSNHNETGDWSYDATKLAFADWNQITVYKAGVLVWGKEPGVATPPAVPTALAALAGVHKVTLSWVAGENDASYNVYRRAANGARSLLGSATATGYVDDAVVDGTRYTYWVSGVNGALESALSDSAVATPVGEAPAKVTGIVAVAGDAVVDLSWKASAGATSYKILRGPEGGTLSLLTTVSTVSYKDATAANGKTYAYKVVASNVWGDAPASDSVLASPEAPLVPAVPTGLAALAGVHKVTLSWIAGENDASYNVYRKTIDGARTLLGKSTRTSYVDDAVVDGTQYTYWVSGVNGALESALSDSATAIPSGEAPAMVTGLVATAGDAVVDLSWTASTGATSYKILRGLEGGTLSLLTTISTASYKDASVVNGTTYTYNVVASNVWGDAPASDSVLATPAAPLVPAVPTELVAVAGVHMVTLSWVPGENDASYNVYRKTIDGTRTLLANSFRTSYVDDAVVDGTRYTYWVSGVNGALESALSDSAVAAPVGEAPAKVTGLVATAGNAVVDLSWTASTGATSYKILRGVEGGTMSLLTTVSTASYKDVTVVNGTTYAYKVVASNVWGDALASDSVLASPKAPVANIKAQYRAGNGQASTNGIQPILKLVNTGSTSIPLSEITVRYWFTNDGRASVNYWCDWAQVGAANLTGTVKAVSPARSGADRYLEVAFKASAGSIAAGGTSGEIQNRFSKSDWTNFTQTNDASFDATKTAFADWNKVTVYRNGVLVWGVEP
ncbi:MAG TPA: cellulose binding domain-containing protein [Fibrobacteria bacterium]|nr:cellulose binding domain-containing protein [Fibrobacteria bacterium]